MKRYPMHESIPVGLLLAVSGGMMNAYSYLNRGQVFATMETGNLILLGINLSRGRLDLVLHYLFPILAFACGVLFTELVCLRMERKGGRLNWRQLLMSFECLTLAVVSLLPLGSWDALANILISFIAAIQVESYRSIHGNACATTMCTGNLRSGCELLFRFLCGDQEAGAKVRFYFALIGAFLSGVLLCGFLTAFFGGHTILIACLFQLIVLFLLFREPHE